MGAAELAGHDDALHALMVPFDQSELDWPTQGRVLFMGARDGDVLHRFATDELLCQQNFKPFADVLEHSGMRVGEPAVGDRFDLVMQLLPRQRDERRAMLARGVDRVAPGGVILMAVSNRDGARSAQADLAQLAGTVRHLSKYKCRVCWTRPAVGSVDAQTREQWLALDALRPTLDSLVSRPGLFAWDRVDPASALLAGCLPESLSGRVADLGAGAGYLSVQLTHRCPGVRHIDLYEADARAVEAAEANMRAACGVLAQAPSFAVHWHDVVGGLPEQFDAIVSNPPFHQSHADLPQLGRAFIATAGAALRPGGVFLMVANRHLPYEATLREHFAEVQMLVEHSGFKVIEAHR